MPFPDPATRHQGRGVVGCLLLVLCGAVGAAEQYVSPEWHGQVVALNPDAPGVIPLEGLEVVEVEHSRVTQTDAEGRFFLDATKDNVPLKWYPGFSFDLYSVAVDVAGFTWRFGLSERPNDLEEFKVEATLVVDPQYTPAPFSIRDRTVSLDVLQSCGEPLLNAVAMVEVARALAAQSKASPAYAPELARLATSQYCWAKKSWALLDRDCDGKAYEDPNSLRKIRWVVDDEAWQWIAAYEKQYGTDETPHACH